MLKINRFTLATLFLILSLCISLVNTQPVFADDSTPPTETPVVVDETPTEEPVVESTPTEEPVIENTPTEEPVIENTPTEETIIDQTATETPVNDEPEAVPSPEEEEQPAETEVNILLEELPENTSVVVLNEQGETVPLVSQEAAEIVLDEDPMWCPEGVLPGGTGCTINYSSIANLMTQLNSNPANYAQHGVIYFTSGNTGASFSLTSGNAFNAMRNYNLTLQGGWNGTNGAGATFTGQSAFGSSSLTLGTSGSRWGGNITISNFTFSGNSSTAVTVYTSDGDITLNNVDVSQQTGNNTALLNTTNGDILVQNGSSFDSNNSNSGGGQYGNGFSATSTNGSITITGTSTDPITFQDARGPGGTNYNGATLSAPTVTLAYVTARDNDGHGIQISNANVVTLNNVISGPTAFGGDGNDLSGIRVFGTGSTIVAAFGGIFADNGQYGIHVTNGSLFVSGTPNCGSGGTSNGIACYNPATPGTIPASTLNLPANMTVPATGPSGAVVNFSATATDFAGRALVVTCNPPSGSTFPITTTTVNCSATNVFGTTVSGSFTVTVQPVDTTPPVLNLPSNSSHEATSAAGAVVTYSASANDAVDGPVAVTCNPASGSTFPLGSNTVNCSATDAAGNSANGSFTITVVDTGAPVLNLPSNSTHEATSAAGTVVTYSASANDAVDGPVAVTCNPASGSTFPLGPNTVNCSATDAAGNSANGSFTITVVDTGAPVLNLPSNSTHEATSAAGAVVTYSASANDAVDGPVAVTCNPASGSTFPLGPNTVTCSATDAAGNSANGSFTITVVDTGAPVLNLPSNSTHEATSAAGAVVTYSASANDAVDGPVAVTCNPASGSTFPLGPNTVNCSATDAAGNSANGSFTITVVDTGAPVLNLPSNSTHEATSAAGAVVTYSASANDAVDGPVAVTCNPASGSTFPLGPNTVNCSATDAAGNSANGSFTITVVDTGAPVLNLPSNSTHEATSAAGAVVTFSASANDAVDGPVAVTCNPASGSTFPLGPNTVTCSATDAAGNSANGSFTITIVDTTPPTLNLPSNSSHEATSLAGAVVTFSATATDLVSGSVSVTCNPASGSTFPLGPNTVNCSATDAAGNSANGNFTVTVVDTTPPTLNLPSNSSHEATSLAGAVVTYSATATDLVSGSVTVTCNPASGSAFPLGSNTVNCSATDAAGNTANGSFTITVVDTTPPTLNLPGTITEQAASPAGKIVTYSASATDLVSGSVAIVCTPISGSNFEMGATVVNCSATDAAGNTANGSFTVNVVDGIAPTLSLPSNIIEEATSSAGAQVDFTVSATDVIDGDVSVTCSDNSGDAFPFGDTTVTCSATDTAGNTTNGSFMITVRDTTAPALNLPSDINEEATSASGAAVTFSLSALDIVDGDLSGNISCSSSSGDTFPFGLTIVDCSVSDAAGNNVNGSFTVTVADTTAPLISAQANINVVTSNPAGAVVDYVTPTTNDAVDGAGVASCAPAPGSMFGAGNTLVTCSATDTNGNTASMSFNVNVTYTSPGGGGGGGTNSGGGGSSPSGGVPGLTGFIPVTGTAYAFDITCPPSKLMKQYRDFTLHFQNLCGYQGIVEILTTSTLPAPLNGQTLISAFSLSTLKGGKAVEKLPTGAEIIIDFNVPASYLNSELQILFWNGLKWVEVEGKWNGAMYEATVTYTGIFILVKE